MKLLNSRLLFSIIIVVKIKFSKNKLFKPIIIIIIVCIPISIINRSQSIDFLIKCVTIFFYNNFYYVIFIKIVFQGDIANENQVLQWMTKQKTDESIEHIDREKLFEYIDNQDFLAVFWCKYCAQKDLPKTIGNRRFRESIVRVRPRATHKQSSCSIKRIKYNILIIFFYFFYVDLYLYVLTFQKPFLPSKVVF